MRIEGDCVASMIVMMQVRARLMKTLFVRVQSKINVGKNNGSRGSNGFPSSEAAAPIRSIAAPERRVRSDTAAEFSG